MFDYKLTGVKRDLIILIGIAFAFKIFTILLTNSLHSFIDLFDYNYYFENMKLISGVKIPYVDFPFDYPPIAIVPMLAAFWISAGAFPAFMSVFQLFMVLCDAATIIGIYFIAITIWGNRKRAFLAGLLYACSLPVAYFTLTKFDALPTMLLVWGILLGLQEKKTGYLVSAVGAFTKVFPGIAIPFMYLWNIKEKDWKKEVQYPLVALIGLAIITVVPFLIAGAKIQDVFTILIRDDIYANTPAFLLHIYTGLPASLISDFLLMLGGAILVFLLYKMVEGRKSPVLALKLILCALVVVVFAARFHSPQYLMWYTPLLCLLVGANIELIGLLVFSQILAYIEFPVMFGSVWTNASYVNPMVATIFFSLEYLVTILLLIMILRNFHTPNETHI